MAHDDLRTGVIVITDCKSPYPDFGREEMKRTIFTALAGLTLSCSAYAASFDCAKARTKVENLICADAALSKLDEEMADAYKNALKTADPAASIRQAQKLWINERNNGADPERVKNAYIARIALLSDARNLAAKAAVQGKTQQQKIKGKFINTYVGSTACQTLTRNISEFRHLDTMQAPCSTPPVYWY